MNPQELVAILTTKSDTELLALVRLLAGGSIGDPLNDNLDSVRLRERFSITVEHQFTSTFAIHDTFSAAVNSRVRPKDQAARLATVIILAALYESTK